MGFAGDSGFLYHCTLRSLLPQILMQGLRPDSCWGSRPVAVYYGTRGGEATGPASSLALIKKPISDFNPSWLLPDPEVIKIPFHTHAPTSIPMPHLKDTATRLAFRHLGLTQPAHAQPGTWRSCWAVYQALAYARGLSIHPSEVQAVSELEVARFSGGLITSHPWITALGRQGTPLSTWPPMPLPSPALPLTITL